MPVIIPRRERALDVIGTDSSSIEGSADSPKTRNSVDSFWANSNGSKLAFDCTSEAADVFKENTVLSRVPENIRWMNCGHDCASIPKSILNLESPSSLLSDPGPSCNSLKSSISKEECMSRTHCFDFSFQINTAGFPMSSLRPSVILWSALDSI
jgi:hypothetical protein